MNSAITALLYQQGIRDKMAYTGSEFLFHFQKTAGTEVKWKNGLISQETQGY